MKTKLTALSILSGIFLFLFIFYSSQNIFITREAAENGYVKQKISGNKFQKEYFEHLYYPYKGGMPSEVIHRMWNDIKNLPSENEEGDSSPDDWRCIGPFGFNINYSGTGFGSYSGRVVDFEFLPNGSRFVASTGGLWQNQSVIQYPLGDDISTQAMGSFDSKPGDPNSIIVGTGEPINNEMGTGFWKTRNGGNTWVNVFTNPTACYKLRYDPDNPDIIHAATNIGYYRSDDAGDTWNLKLPGVCTDLDFLFEFTLRVCYTSVWGDGIYKSTNQGLNWAKVTAPGLPTTNVGRVAISSAFDNTTHQTFIYALIMRNDNGNLFGVFKSTNEGNSWVNVATPNLLGFSDNRMAIGVCPTNPEIVLIGSVKLFKTSNAGSSWLMIDGLHPNNHDKTHDDWHRIVWKDETTVYCGNDGGISHSFDAGETWNSVNYAPITQFYNITAGVNNSGVIYGGAQDNGVVGTINGGAGWLGTICCDGLGVTVDPNDASKVYAISGGEPGQGTIYRSNNFGISWQTINNGLTGGRFLRNDRSPSIALYTNNYDRFVYWSSNSGANWIRLGGEPLPVGLWSLDVAKFSPVDGTTVYAALNSNEAGKILRVYDNGNWYERSAGLPNRFLSSVSAHQTDPNIAYITTGGVNLTGQKVYKTTNKGINWINITGNLPNISVTDVLSNPTNDNVLYLGSIAGCYKTTNSGSNWFRWNNGMPEGTLISEFTYIDSTTSNGRFYIVAGTYGRSIWLRDVSTDDPKVIVKQKCCLNKGINDFQSTNDTLNFSEIPQNSIVKSVNIIIDSVLHTNDGDLRFSLTHNGITRNFISNAGLQGDNFIATNIKDSYEDLVSNGVAPFSGKFKPSEALSQFNQSQIGGDWILKILDNAAGNTGQLKAWSLAIEYDILVGINGNSSIPKVYSLSQNYPNPFNPGTTIQYNIEHDANVRITIYDVLGREVTRLVNENKKTGSYSILFDGSKLSSGVYFYRLEATGGNWTNFTDTKKMLLIK